MDKYDEEIEFLTKRPHFIVDHWANARPLFRIIGNTSVNSGCPTMIRKCGMATILHSGNKLSAFIKGKLNEEITKGIMMDERLPGDPYGIEVKHLPVFAEWQRKVDELENA